MALMDRKDRRNKKPATKIIKKTPAKQKPSAPTEQVSVGEVQPFGQDWTSVAELEALIGKVDSTVVIFRLPAKKSVRIDGGAYHRKPRPKQAKSLKGVIGRLATYGFTQDDYVIISGPPSAPVGVPEAHTGLLN